jgi:hypothetical protein
MDTPRQFGRATRMRKIAAPPGAATRNGGLLQNKAIQPERPGAAHCSFASVSHLIWASRPTVDTQPHGVRRPAEHLARAADAEYRDCSFRGAQRHARRRT